MISNIIDSTAFGDGQTLSNPLRWIVRLRWWAVCGQLLAVGIAVYFVNITLPIYSLAAVISALAFSNLCLKFRPLEVWQLGWITLFDVIILTLLLGLSGGAANPFSIFYLVHVALSAVLLSAIWTWTIALVSSCTFGILFLYSVPVEELHMHHGSGFSFHLVGMWIAFTLSACLIAYFQTKIVEAVRMRDERLQNLVGRQERLASVTTLAASAAHELGTPLGTIAIAATEIERSLSATTEIDKKAIAEDTELIVREIARCRSALEQIALGAGETVSELPEKFTLREVARALEVTANAKLDRLFEFDCTTPDVLVSIPVHGLCQSVTALIKNALEAGSVEQIKLTISANEREFQICVSDNGEGMDKATLDRLGEPFFSTKGPGHGMGLGVFLVRLFAERLGGQLHYRSIKGRGTEAKLYFPGRAVNL